MNYIRPFTYLSTNFKNPQFYAIYGDAKCRGISLNLKTHTVCVNNVPTEFTQREFEILYELMKAPGKVVTRKALLNDLLGYGYYNDTRIVDTHIKKPEKSLPIMIVLKPCAA